MIRIIALSLTIVFVFSFSLLLLFDEFFGAKRVSEIENDTFFSKEFQLNSKKIFTIGGSGVGQLDSTLIHNLLNSNNENYVFYNLAYNADTPEQRINSIQSTISLNPQLVLYGVSYYDFNGFEFLLDQKTTKPLPDIKNNFENLLQIKKNPISKFNPKENTLSFIRDSFNENEIFSTSNKKFQLEHSPFTYFSQYQTIVSSDEELKNITKEIVSQRVNQNVQSHEEQIAYFEEIIQSLKNENIEIVVFILPQQKYFHELIPESDKKSFHSAIDKIKEKYGIPVYDLTKRYDNLEIWQDHNHVAYNERSQIFSNDIYKIILEELK